MKRIICFFICIVFTCFIYTINAQYYLKTNADSIPLSGDSTILTLGVYRGELVWQVSSDSTNWDDLMSSGDSLAIRIDSSAVYRGSISEENCETIFSDTILVGEEIIHPSAYYFWAYSTGGVYYLPGGIKVKIPPGAIKDSLYMLVEPIDSIDSYVEFPGIVDNGRNYLGGLNVLPYETVFDKPIKIQFPVREFNSGDKLILSGFDPYLKTPMDYTSYFLASGAQKFIEYNTNLLIPVRAEAIVYRNQQGESGKKSLAKDDKECRRGIMVITSKQSDYASHFKPAPNNGSDPGSCQTITSSNQIIYVDCDNLTEYDRIQEISSQCEPVLTLSLEQNYLKVGNQSTVRATLKIGDLPLAGQQITISSSNSLGLSKTSDVTDENGDITFTISGKVDDEEAYIRCNSDVTYYLQEIEVSGALGNETQKNWKRENHLTAERGLKVYSTKIDRWQGTLSASTENFCGRYDLNIEYEFTLYWDSLAYQKEKYNSTGGIFGSATVSQSSTNSACSYESGGSQWEELWGYVSSTTADINDPFWSSSKEGTLHFISGYLGWWEQNWFDEVKEEWVKLASETYYDLGPVNKQRISFTNSDHIESTIMYNNIYGFEWDVYVEYGAEDEEAIEAHLVLDRTYSNYEDIGQ